MGVLDRPWFLMFSKFWVVGQTLQLTMCSGGTPKMLAVLLLYTQAAVKSPRPKHIS